MSRWVLRVLLPAAQHLSHVLLSPAGAAPVERRAVVCLCPISCWWKEVLLLRERL